MLLRSSKYLHTSGRVVVRHAPCSIQLRNYRLLMPNHQTTGFLWPAEPVGDRWKAHIFGELPDPDGGRRRWASWEPPMWIFYLAAVWWLPYVGMQQKWNNRFMFATEEVIERMNYKELRQT